MFWPAVVGFKYKMSNIQAAMGCAQLLRISELVCKRQETLASYKKELLPLGNVSMNPNQEGCENGAWMPTVVADGKQNTNELVLKRLRTKGIDARPFFAPLSQLGLFSRPTVCPQSVRLANLGLNLPSFFEIGESDIKTVIESIRVAFSEGTF